MDIETDGEKIDRSEEIYGKDEEEKRINVLSLISPSFFRAYRDVLCGMDTDPHSPTFRQKLREYFFSGGRGCVDGDTLLDTPNGKVRVRDFEGGDIYAFDGERRIVATACRPRRYTREPLYRVSFSSGASIIVTNKHRFLTPSGWKTLDSLSESERVYALPSSFSETLGLSNGSGASDPDFSVSSTFASAVPDSSTRSVSLGIGTLLLPGSCGGGHQSGSPGDALRSTRKLLGCLYRYWSDFRLCDGLPPREEETYLDIVRRLADAPGHNQGSSREDGLASVQSDNHAQRGFPRSRRDCPRLSGDRYCEAKESEISRTLSESLSAIFPSMAQCPVSEDLDGSIRRVARLLLCSMRRAEFSSARTGHREDEMSRMLYDMLQRRVDDESYSDSFLMNEDATDRAPHSVLVNVVAVEFVKEDFYYDLFVPFYNCYFAEGVLNHNSTKSSFISLMIVLHLLRNGMANAVVFVKVAENIRDSVYKQICWAIDKLGLTKLFKCTTSPFRCVYLPTKQEILFRGLDKAGKLKGIKPTKGYFDTIWFEELTEFTGMEECRSVIQSVLRGSEDDDDQSDFGDEKGGDTPTWEFYSYNPPPTQSNWVNEASMEVVPGRKVYKSNYLSVPPKWLGKNFFIRADILRQSNPRAWRHEYMGEITGTGGSVFTNLEIRPITDEEIVGKFVNRRFGIDWGFTIDPFVWLAMHFDTDRLILYIYDEIYERGLRTQQSAEKVRKKMNRLGNEQAHILADQAEPDSIADFNAWGLNVEGAPKPHGTAWSGRDYSIQALSNLVKIVIDPKYAPNAAREFKRYEYDRNTKGQWIAQYPKHDDHTIDAARYGVFFDLRNAGLMRC